MRPPLEERLLRLAEHIASWSTCHIKHGAVLAEGNRIVALGYNGSLPGEPHCVDVGCELHRGHCIRTIHAEHNAIFWANKVTGKEEYPDAVLYVTGSPCPDCQEIIAVAGIKKVVYRVPYRSIKPRSNDVEWVEWGWGNAH